MASLGIKVGAGLVGAALLIQLYKPARTNPPMSVKQDISAVMHVDEDVKTILDRSCNDCHTNRTIWPWYSGIAPLSWGITSDVSDGRRHMNFSEWGTYQDFKQKDLLAEACKLVTEHQMPPLIYSMVHREARLSGADREAICRWSKANTD